MDRSIDRRSSARREHASRISMSRDSEKVYGWVRNISDDGALVLVDGTSRFLQSEVGDKIDIEAFPDAGLPQLPKAGKLVRMFDVDGQQYLALRFLDYMDDKEG